MAKSGNINISKEVLEVLNNASITDSQLVLNGTLDRKLYEDVNQVLVCLGGKWNKSKKAHVFKSDVQPILQSALKTGHVTDKKKKYELFESTPEVVNRLILFADLWDDLKVLEPSAGSGRICKAILEENKTCKIDVCEIQDDLREQLAKDYNVIGSDFLALEPQETYDRIIMNPPFSNKQDLDHIQHAFKFLKTGGRMAALTAGGWRRNTDKKSKAFNELVNDYGMCTEDLPSGTFKESGTMVATTIVVLWKY